VISLLGAVGTITERHDGKIAVKIGSAPHFIVAPAGGTSMIT
jgi:hypothetical protein